MAENNKGYNDHDQKNRGQISPRYSERYGLNRPNPYTGYLPPAPPAAKTAPEHRPELTVSHHPLFPAPIEEPDAEPDALPEQPKREYSPARKKNRKRAPADPAMQVDADEQAAPGSSVSGNEHEAVPHISVKKSTVPAPAHHAVGEIRLSSEGKPLVAVPVITQDGREEIAWLPIQQPDLPVTAAEQIAPGSFAAAPEDAAVRAPAPPQEKPAPVEESDPVDKTAPPLPDPVVAENAAEPVLPEPAAPAEDDAEPVLPEPAEPAEADAAPAEDDDEPALLESVEPEEDDGEPILPETVEPAEDNAEPALTEPAEPAEEDAELVLPESVELAEDDAERTLPETDAPGEDDDVVIFDGHHSHNIFIRYGAAQPAFQIETNIDVDDLAKTNDALDQVAGLPEEMKEEADVPSPGQALTVPDDDTKVAPVSFKKIISNPVSKRSSMIAIIDRSEVSHEQDETLFVKTDRPEGATTVFRIPEGIKLSAHIDDEEFLEQWLNEGDAMAAKDKRIRRRVSTMIGFITILLAAVGFVAVVQHITGAISSISDNSGKNAEYEVFIRPVVLSDPNPFESWTGAEKEKLLECAILRCVGDSTGKYSFDDTGRIIIPSGDVTLAARQLFGDDVSLDLYLLNAVASELYFYSDADDCFHVTNTGIEGSAPEIIGSPRREGNTITLLVGYRSETSEEGEYFKRMQFILTTTEDGYYISALREYNESA